MASTIITKYSGTASAVPVSGDLTQGELAVNTADKRLFTKNGGGTVVELGINPSSLTMSGGTANGVAYLNGSKVVTTGSALTFDGTSLGVGSTAATQTLIRPYTGGSYGAIYSGAVTPGGTNFVFAYNATETDINGGTFISHLIGGSEQMRLTSTGLGIGTSSPAATLDVSVALPSVQVKATTGTNRVWFRANNSGGDFYIGRENSAGSAFGVAAYSSLLWSQGAYPMVFATDGTERARIDSSGNLLVGTTSGLTGQLRVYNGISARATDNYNGSPNIRFFTGVDTTGGIYCDFWNSAGTTIGTITRSGTSSVGYNTTSDYRLKENQALLTGSGAFIDALQPKTWTWKEDGSKGVGFIAHEVAEVSPGTVVGEKDAVDEEGKPKYQAMEYGSAEFIANIIAELQSLRKRVTQLEGK